MKQKKLLAIPVVLAAALIGWKLLSRPEFRYAGTVEAMHAFHPGAALSMGDFAPAFFVVGALAAASYLFFLRLPREAGSDVTGSSDRRGNATKIPPPQDRAAAE